MIYQAHAVDEVVGSEDCGTRRFEALRDVERDKRLVLHDEDRAPGSAFTFVASILCIVLVMRPTVVSGASMMPTLHDKDVLIVSPLAERLFQPIRGDIVTVCLSANPLCGFVFSGDTQYVKRIVAVPGDVVRYSACNILVNTGTGREIKDTHPTMSCHDRWDFKQIVLPEGSISSPVIIVGIVSIREFSAQSAGHKSMPKC